MFEIFEFPFMQRAFAAGIILGAVLGFLGVFVVLRRMAFFSDGIAHASLSGVAIGVLAGLNPLVTALGVSVLFSVVLFYLEKKARLSSDTVIGIIFTSGMALGVMLMSLKSGYQPDLIGFLFGNILAIRQSEFWMIAALSAGIGVFLLTQARNITLMALDEEFAYLSGARPTLFRFLMNIVLAVAVVLGIKILGVVLVSALLIIPVSIAKLISRSFGRLVFWSVALSELIVITGLFISYFLDLPTGAVIVLTGTALFFTVLLFQRKISNVL